MSRIGERLAQARQSRGFSRRALSLEAGLAQAVAGQIERGDVAEPGASTLVALASVLGVSLDWLVKGEGPGPDEAAA